MKKFTRRAVVALAATVLALGMGVTPASAKTIGDFDAPHPDSLVCSTKGCKTWYRDYVGFAATFLARPLDAESLHNMRKMAAMATGGSAWAAGSVARLENVDYMLVLANKSKTARACAAGALFFAGAQAAQNKAAVKDAQKVFKAMKKIAKRYPTLKAYANVGYQGTKVASAINQLVILQALQTNLRGCV